MPIVTAQQAARILGITTDSLYRRVHSGEIPTVDPGEALQPTTGHRAFAFDRDAIAGMELRPLGRPPTYAPDECARTFLRCKKHEARAWESCASKHGVSVSEWLRAIANAEARRATLKLIVPKATRAHTTHVWVRGTFIEARAWQVAAARAKVNSTNRWLRYLANAAVAA